MFTLRRENLLGIVALLIIIIFALRGRLAIGTPNFDSISQSQNGKIMLPANDEH
ncbi:MAG: hypothetical protein R3B45_08430 [Bdellovibrionota bacterium]